MRKFGIILMTIAVMALFPWSASATVIDFEDLAVSGSANDIGGDRTSRGFFFDSLTNHTHIATNSFSGNSGSSFLVTDDFRGFNTTKMTMLGGGTFGLASIDLGEWNPSDGVGTTITATGALFGGGVVVQSFTLDGIVSMGGSNNFETFLFSGFSNLTDVTFRATAGTGVRYWAMDNITTGVVEPGTMLLFGAGLAGLGFVRRRRPSA